VQHIHMLGVFVQAGASAVCCFLS